MARSFILHENRWTPRIHVEAAFVYATLKMVDSTIQFASSSFSGVQWNLLFLVEINERNPNVHDCTVNTITTRTVQTPDRDQHRKMSCSQNRFFGRLDFRRPLPTQSVSTGVWNRSHTNTLERG